MSGKVFIDTNILLRATIERFPLHQNAKQLVAAQIIADNELWISRQVLREYMVQATRPQSFMNPLSTNQVVGQIEKMRALFSFADETEAVTTQLIALMQEHRIGGKQIHDANIVATMLAHGIGTLLTLNVADMKRFGDKITLISLNPDDSS